MHMGQEGACLELRNSLAVSWASMPGGNGKHNCCNHGLTKARQLKVRPLGMRLNTTLPDKQAGQARMLVKGEGSLGHVLEKGDDE